MWRVFLSHSSADNAEAVAIRDWRALAHSLVSAQANEGRCHRTRQQDRKDGVGHDGQG
jgi:hypothetical protein